MKAKLLVLLFSMLIFNAFSQNWGDDFYIDFDDPENMDHLFLDSIAYPDNIWQVGPPQKAVLNNSSSFPNVIITDTINTYPVNNASAFIIKDIASVGMIQGMEVIIGEYYVHSDTLNDIGMIEFSPDNGITWIDLIEETIYGEGIKWFTDKPVLTGNSGGWKYFEFYLYQIPYNFNTEIGDTVLYRFSFYSDGIPDNMDGLMYDNLGFMEFVEGISEIRYKAIETEIYPNPSSSQFRIEFENPHNDSFQLNIYDMQSNLVSSDGKVKGTYMGFDASQFASGSYIYKLTNNNRNERGWGKFVVK